MITWVASQIQCLIRGARTLSIASALHANGLRMTGGGNLAFPLGLQLDDPGVYVTVTSETFSRHALLLGSTGSGKSTLLELLARCLIDTPEHAGGTLIDPPGDTVQNVLVWLASKEGEPGYAELCQRVHILKPRLERVFRYNRLAFHPNPAHTPEQQVAARRAWAEAEAERLSQTLSHHIGDLNGLAGRPRVKRMLKNVIYAVAIAGLSLVHTLVLLNIQHPLHEQVYEQCLPYLDGDIRADFELLRSLANARPGEYFAQVEGALNRIKAFMSILVKAIVGDMRKGLDLKRIVREKHFLLVDLSSPYLSDDQRGAVAALLVDGLINVVRSLPRSERTLHYLLVDEAGSVISPLGESFKLILTQARKWSFPIVLAGQNLESFKSGDFDLTEFILNEPGSVFAFQTKSRRTLEELVDGPIGLPNLDFTELVTRQQFQDGFKIVPVVTETIGFSCQESSQSSQAIAATRTDTQQRGTTRSTTRSTQDGTSWQHQQGASHAESVGMTLTEAHGTTNGRTQSTADSESESTSHGSSQQEASTRSNSRGLTRGESETRGIRHDPGDIGTVTNGRGKSEARSDMHGTSTSRSRSQQESASSGTAHTESESESEGESHTRSLGQSQGETETTTESENVGGSRSVGLSNGESSALSHSAAVGGSLSVTSGAGLSEGMTRSRAVQYAYQPNIVDELVPQGRPRFAIPDQKERMMQQLSTFLPGQAAARLFGRERTVVLQCEYPAPPFTGAEFYERLDWMVETLERIHADEYLSSPELTLEQEQQRLAEPLQRHIAAPARLAGADDVFG